MPFQSRAQQRWGHTKAGEEALGGPAKVAEWDAATKGKDIPERVAKESHAPHNHGGRASGHTPSKR